MDTVVVVGNPKTGSRTARAAALVAERLVGGAPRATIELAELGGKLLTFGDPEVEAAKQTVHASDLVVFASPTFKATYTGLLKCFLDQFDAGELGGKRAVALMLGASERHALAAELTLRPVLTEIGCSCPAPALFLLESEWESSRDLEDWLPRATAAYGIGETSTSV